MKRILSLALSLAVILAVLPSGLVTAHGAEIIGSGTCGDNLKWQLNSSGGLSIWGIGTMDNFTSANHTSAGNAPWYDYQTSVQTVSVGEGVETTNCEFVEVIR